VTDLVPYTIEALDRQHDRAAFSCGHESLDRYFKEATCVEWGWF